MPKHNPSSPMMMNSNGDADWPTHHIYDYIGYWDSSAEAVARFLKEHRDENVVIRINSFGGSAYDGIAIKSLLQAHKKTVHAYIDAIAASAATVIACGADQVFIVEGALYMIHDPSSFMWLEGTADDIEGEAKKEAEHLRKLTESVIDIYETRTKKSREEIREKMLVESFFTASETVEFGFADAVLKDDEENYSQLTMSLRRQTKEHPQAQAVKDRLFSVQNSTKLLLLLSKEGGDMPKQNQPQDPVVDNKPSQVDLSAEREKLRAEMKAQETSRRSGIEGVFAKATDHVDLKNECLLDLECTPDLAKEKLLNALLNQKKPCTDEPIANTHITVEDDLSKNMELMCDSLVTRVMNKPVDRDNPWNDVGLKGMARAVLNMNGVNTMSMHDMDIVDRALDRAPTLPRNYADGAQTITSFPILNAEFVRRVLLEAYRLAPHTWKTFCSIMDLQDFRQTDLISYGIAQTLDKKGADGNYVTRLLSDAEYGSIQADEFGARYAVARKSIYNDDLYGIGRQFKGIGSTAGRTVENFFYAWLFSNPMLPDGKRLFDASRGNLLDAGPMAGAIWTEVRNRLALQKAINTNDADADNHDYLDLRPDHLLTSVQEESTVIALNTATTIQPDGTAVAQATNGMFPREKTTATARMTDKGSIYLSRDVEILVAGFVRGGEEPLVTYNTHWESGDPEVRVQLDFGMGLAGWRGIMHHPSKPASGGASAGKKAKDE